MDMIGGYRLVRALGEGPRARVHLARLDDEPDAAVVVKAYRDEVTEESVSTEIEALARAVGEHTVPLLDVAMTPSGAAALIIARLPGGSLTRLLTHRRNLRLEEVTGVLAPLAEALHAMHRRGVAHGGIRPDAVLFDADGFPTLACFGRATLFQPGLPPALVEEETGAEGDRRALAALARLVLERCGDPEPARPLLDWLMDGVPGADFCVELSMRLRQLAQPGPVDLHVGSEVAVASAVPARVPVQVSPAPLVRPRRVPSDPVATIVGSMIGRERVTAFLDSVRRVRVRIWLLAGAAIVALAAALVLIPGGDHPPQAVAPTATITPAAGPDLRTGDETPEVALVRLLQLRERCIRDRSVLCLDGVAQQGSAAIADDQELVLGLQGGAETPPPFTVRPAQVSVVEELGDAVLLAIDGADGQMAAVLLARGEHGWLVRDYLDR